jgi:hypothetical protein
MGDWNEWDDIKETIVNDNLISNKDHRISSKLDVLEDCYNKYTYVGTINDRKKKITMYSSSYAGGYAVNAIDNTMYNIRIGTNDEKYLFSVRFTREKFKGRESDIITLFYDSPYSYETHHGVTLNPNIISQWYNTFNKLPQRATYFHRDPVIENVIPEPVGVVVK